MMQRPTQKTKARACLSCCRDHRGCDGQRPCQRCISAGLGSICSDVALYKRKRLRPPDSDDAHARPEDTPQRDDDAEKSLPADTPRRGAPKRKRVAPELRPQPPSPPIPPGDEHSRQPIRPTTSSAPQHAGYRLLQPRYSPRPAIPRARPEALAATRIDESEEEEEEEEEGEEASGQPAAAAVATLDEILGEVSWIAPGHCGFIGSSPESRISILEDWLLRRCLQQLILGEPARPFGVVQLIHRPDDQVSMFYQRYVAASESLCRIVGLTVSELLTAGDERQLLVPDHPANIQFRNEMQKLALSKPDPANAIGSSSIRVRNVGIEAELYQRFQIFFTPQMVPSLLVFTIVNGRRIGPQGRKPRDQCCTGQQ